MELEHIYYSNKDAIENERTIFFNHNARYDALSKIEVTPNRITEYYEKREDRGQVRQKIQEGKIVQKFSRNEELPANKDIAVREFAIADRQIHLKYHYAKSSVTASTRTFIKPPLAEMGDDMVFKPELTYGYQAEIEQLKAEEIAFNCIRDSETLITDFLMLRAHEMAFPKLDVSLFNREQNMEYRLGMLEKEREGKNTEGEGGRRKIDYLAPYLARLVNVTQLKYRQALDIKKRCLTDFKKMMVDRANHLQKKFEQVSSQIEASNSA
ncbi:hypothetical protein NQ317_000040 [Molorchus minor]|uniref:Uncharacterized protein n=1 Tax=Molorchus minor TaxID=1323400 RepID=A0ABQ9JED8_9CUCU|nr:hypothetical protein NQ317_000040 [Molorchus minor]